MYYPTFVLGSAYIIGRNAVDRLLANVPFTSFLWLEDVFTTGMVAKKAKLLKTSMERSFFTIKYTPRLIRGKVVFYVGANQDHFHGIWKEILNYNNIPYSNENG